MHAQVWEPPIDTYFFLVNLASVLAYQSQGNLDIKLAISISKQEKVQSIYIVDTSERGNSVYWYISYSFLQVWHRSVK